MTRTSNPARVGRRGLSPYLDLASQRLYVFVPALMSVGFVFWLAALVRDQFRRRRARSLVRRAGLAGESLASLTLGRKPTPTPTLVTAGQRPLATLAALGFVGLSLYVLIGSGANYFRPGGYSAEIAWILVVSVILSAVFGAAGVFTALVTYRWASLTPRWRRAAARTALGASPDGAGLRGPSPSISFAVIIAAALSVLVIGLVGSSLELLSRGDEPMLTAVAEAGWMGSLQHLDLVGSSLFAIIAGALLGLASFRCRALVASYPVAILGGFLINNSLNFIIERERPPGGIRVDRLDSFPSGHLLQATILAGLFPLSVAVMAHSTRPVRVIRILAAIGVLAGAVHRVHDRAHWPTDVLGSVLIGVTIVLAVEWAIAHQGWHLRCSECPWQPETVPLDTRRGSVPIPMTVARLLGFASHASAVLVAILLAWLTFTRGVPSDPYGSLVDQAIQEPIQLGLAGLVTVAALLSWRFVRLGAVLLAIAATGLGFFAAIEYEPRYAVLVTVLVMVPAVLLWLSWQTHRRPLEIVGLAVGTGVLVTGTWVAASYVYDSTMGGTHPDSMAASVPVDEVEWMWMGALGPDTVTVVVGIDDVTAVRAVAAPVGRPDTASADRTPSTEIEPDGDGIARLQLDGLAPETAYELSIEVDGQADEGRGLGRFTTLPEGPGTFRFVVSACARSGSNAAVFDAMGEEDAHFYVNLGDIHYANIATADAGMFRAAYERLLSAPAQAALYRMLPIAYVWDDHDYGPNDADGTSPTRDVARSAFRQFVPSHRLAEPEGPIHRAFTAGRVRFVVTDTRSERTNTTMLGSAQLAWLERELSEASGSHALVVWVNPTPWVGADSPGVGDTWARYPEERRRIADVIAGAGIDNLLMLSGDAHMLAFDDGTNTDYSSAGGGAAGFPLFHTGALDRPGSLKGGPYSGGTFPGGGQYGVVDIVDDGTTLTVDLEGKTWDGEVLIVEKLVFE